MRATTDIARLHLPRYRVLFIRVDDRTLTVLMISTGEGFVLVLELSKRHKEKAPRSVISCSGCRWCGVRCGASAGQLLVPGSSVLPYRRLNSSMDTTG